MNQTILRYRVLHQMESFIKLHLWVWNLIWRRQLFMSFESVPTGTSTRNSDVLDVNLGSLHVLYRPLARWWCRLYLINIVGEVVERVDMLPHQPAGAKKVRQKLPLLLHALHRLGEVIQRRVPAHWIVLLLQCVSLTVLTLFVPGGITFYCTVL